MKHLSAFLKTAACAAGVWACASCSDREPGDGGGGSRGQFTIEVSDVTPRGATIAIRPQDPAATYYFDVVSAESLRDNYNDDPEACFKSGLQQYIDRYAATLTPEQVLTAIASTGNDRYTYRWLGDASKYYVLAAGITTTELGTTTEVEYAVFETSPLLRNAFSITDIAPTDMTVSATVSSEDPELPYVSYLIPKEEVGQSGLSPEAFIDRLNQEAIAYATGLGVTLDEAVEAISERGESRFSQERLQPAVDFLLLVAGINSEGYVTTEASVTEIRTADPRKSEMTFRFEVDELSPTGAVIRYIPSIKNDRYFYDIAESKDLAGLTDEEIMARRIELAGSYIGFYTTYDDYDNDMKGYLDPDTEYVALAFGYISYITTGLFRSEPFTTPKPRLEQDYGTCAADYYGDRFDTGRGNWRLTLTSEDKSFSLSLNCLAGNVGDFTQGIPDGEYNFSADGTKGAFTILADGSVFTDNSDRSTAAFKSGKIVVSHADGTCTVAVDLTDAADRRIAGSFTGSVAATDCTTYPAIGAMVTAQATFYGGGNWFVNLYDYPLSGAERDTYNLAFDLYVDPASSPAAASGIPAGTYDVVGSGLGVRDNGYTKLQFDSRKICDIESGRLTVSRNGDDYTISFKGSCLLTDIDVSYSGPLKVNNLASSSLASDKGAGSKPPLAAASARGPMASKPMPAPSPKQPAKRNRIPDSGSCLRHFEL